MWVGFQTCKSGRELGWPKLFCQIKIRTYEKIELKVERRINCSKNLTISKEAA